ncbi:MAG: SAM-dependent methyltransferase [Gammaproteobacteria bacterium]|jgi:SAM-dependent methyltransferase|nr:SAM-dependent methyltransferase [Gammaproteobacteria bacterium]
MLLQDIVNEKVFTMKLIGLDWLLTEENARQDEVLACCFGYYLLLLTTQKAQAKLSCPIKQHIVVKCEQEGQQAGVVTDWSHLPFAPGSIDLIVLSHVLDWFAEPQALLQEISTVLRHDGKILITGFNPGRLRARRLAKCYHSKTLQLKLCTSLIMLLENNGFEVCEVKHYGFFTVKNKRLAKYINSLCNRFLSAMGCGYLIVAQKKVLGTIAAKPQWPRPLLETDKVSAPSCRVK